MSCHVLPSRARLLATLQQVALHSLRCSAARHSAPSDIPVTLLISSNQRGPGASSASPAFDHAYHDAFLQLKGSYDMTEVIFWRIICPSRSVGSTRQLSMNLLDAFLVHGMRDILRQHYISKASMHCLSPFVVVQVLEAYVGRLNSS